MQLTDKHTGEVQWYNRVTRLTTPLKPFELGGDAPFHEHGEMRGSDRDCDQWILVDKQHSASGLGGPHAEAVGTSMQAREERRVCVTEGLWGDMQEQLRAADAAAAAAADATAAATEVPEDFYDKVFDCLIMEDPVLAMDGFTYERRRIEEWLALHSRLPSKSKREIPA
jgi:hypothetical protein